MTSVSFFQGAKDVAIYGGNFNLIARMDPSLQGFELLTSYVLPSAFHMANADLAHSTCHPNTRTRALQQIKDWAIRKRGPNSFVIWLDGAAGGGKTAIGRTIAEWCEQEGILLGEFFFSSTSVQGQINCLAATLAYRMATLTLPAAKEAIILAVTRDPLIFQTPLTNQMTKLVLEPLNSEAPRSIVPYVIILDGLDEGLSADEQDLVLRVLSGTLHPLSSELRVLVCSRPEPTIATAFNAPSLQDISTHISLNDQTDSDADIHTFLIERFAMIKEHLLRPPSGEWPTAPAIAYLVEKSSGQFIFASTVVKYVGSPGGRNNAITRLQRVLDINWRRPNREPHPLAELYALYSLILSTRVVEEEEITVKATAVCLEYPKYFNTISPEDLAKVLELELPQTQAMLDELASLFEVNANNIKPFHASFGDFLYDSSVGNKFYCDRGAIVADITCAHLRHGRDPNILSFHSFTLLLDDALPTSSLQNILNEIDPSLIFSGEPFEGDDNVDGYYLISVLQRLQKHVSLGIYEKLISYFDRNFANHIRSLFLTADRQSDDSFPGLQSVSNTDDSDSSTTVESNSPDLQPDSKVLLVTQGGKGNGNNEDGNELDGGVGSRPVQAGGGNKDSDGGVDLGSIIKKDFPVRMLVLLCPSPAWDKFATASNIPPSPMASLMSICDAAPFVRSHLPKTLSVLLDPSRQADAADFCLEQLLYKQTNLRNVIADLLTHSLSHAKQLPRVMRRIKHLVSKRNSKPNRHLPSGIWKSMEDYVSRWNGAYHTAPLSQNRLHASSRRSSTPLTQPPSSTSRQRSSNFQTQQPSGSSRAILLGVAGLPPPSTKIRQPSSATSTASSTQQPASTSKIQQPSSASQHPSATSPPSLAAPQVLPGTSQGPQSTPRKPTKPKYKKGRRK